MGLYYILDGFIAGYIYIIVGLDSGIVGYLYRWRGGWIFIVLDSWGCGGIYCIVIVNMYVCQPGLG